jgi:ABC-type sugar transport system substrate-binding protein
MKVGGGIVVLGVALTAAFALTAGASRQATVRVGFSSDSLTQPAQAEAHYGAVAAAKALKVKLYETHAPDAAGQASGIDTLFAKGIDVLAVDPNDGKAIGTQVKEANKRDIPVVMWIGSNLGGGVVANFTSTNEKLGGYLISKAIFKKLGNKGEVGFIQGCTCHPAGAAREAGFRKALKETPGVKLVAYGSTDWDPVKANTLASDMLSKNPNIDAFIALWDPGASAAYQAAKAAGSDALISGYNGVCSALNQVWKGEIAATLDQNWRGIGTSVVETSVKLAQGQKVPKRILLPSYVIDKPAMQQILKGKYKGSTPSLLASVKAAVGGCK